MPSQEQLNLFKATSTENGKKKKLPEALPEATQLLIMVKPGSGVAPELMKQLVTTPADLSPARFARKLGIPVVLNNPLRLKPRTRSLNPCSCKIPSLQRDVESLNEAATVVSEVFETSRKSHTKDVFREVFFYSESGQLIHLENWRDEICPRHLNIDNAAKRLSKKANSPDDFNRILDLITTSREMAEIVTRIQNTKPDEQATAVQGLLNTLVGVETLKKISCTWIENKDNSIEAFWQDFFDENSFVLSQLFAKPAVAFKSQVYVGGKGIDNKGGKVADFLLRNQLTRNVALIEIKTPKTPLFGVQQADGVFAPSSELSQAVTQLQGYRDSLLKDFYRLSSRTDKPFEAISPQCVVIVGHLGPRKGAGERERSIELFRNGLKDIELITYDEVFKKIDNWIALLGGKA